MAALWGAGKTEGAGPNLRDEPTGNLPKAEKDSGENETGSRKIERVLLMAAGRKEDRGWSTN